MKSVSTVVLLTLLSAAGANPLEKRQLGKGKGKSGGSGLSAMLGGLLNCKPPLGLNSARANET
jgi:hypothetical protein